MTAKQKVKNVYPDAVSSKHGVSWIIRAYKFGPCLGKASHRESWAWADAWRSIHEPSASGRESEGR